jgi:hypothetical protein
MEPSDPILDELHKIREAIAAASDNDIRKIAEAARSREKEGGAEIVNLPPKLVADKKAS